MLSAQAQEYVNSQGIPGINIWVEKALELQRSRCSNCGSKMVKATIKNKVCNRYIPCHICTSCQRVLVEGMEFRYNAGKLEGERVWRLS